VSDISPFLLVPRSATGCPVVGEAEAIAVFLDFFPIMLESTVSEEFCTGVKMNVMQKIDSANQM